MSAKRPDVIDRFNASWRAGVRSELSGLLGIGGGLLPTPTPPLVPPSRFVCCGDAGDRGWVGGTSLGKPSPGSGEMLSWEFFGEGEGVRDEGSRSADGITGGEEGGFRKSLRISSLGFDVHEVEGKSLGDEKIVVGLLSTNPKAAGATCKNVSATQWERGSEESI